MRFARVADGLLVVLLVGSPLAVGTVHLETWLAVFGLSAVAACAALLATDQPPRPPALALLLIGAWGSAVLLPLIPLPDALLSRLSPGAAALRDVPLPGGASPALWPVHQAPGEGALEVLRWASVSLFALAVGWRLADRTMQRRLPWLLLASGVLAALVCLIQTGLQEPLILWLYQPRHRETTFWKPTFVNPNHWSAWLTLVAAIGAGLVLSERSRPQRWLAAAVGTALVVVLLLWAPSRSGILGAAAAASVLGLASLRGRPSLRRVVGTVLTVGGGAAAAALVVMARTRSRLDPFSGEVLGEFGQNPRVDLVQDARSLLAAHPWTGIGRGALYDVLPSVRERPGTSVSRWVEVFPADMLVGFGLPLGALILLVLVALLVQGFRRARMHPARVGAAAGLFGLAVHEMADLATQTGAVLLTSVAAGLWLLRATADRSMAVRWGWCAVAALLACTAAVGPSLRHADSERCEQRLSDLPWDEQDWPAFGRDEHRWHPASFPLALRVAVEAQQRGALADALPWLNRAQRLAPRHPWPHLWTARLLRSAGLEGQALGEYRRAMEGDWRLSGPSILEEVAGAYDDVASLEALLPPDLPAARVQMAAWLLDLRDPRAVEVGAGQAAVLPDLPAALLVDANARMVRGESGALGLLERAWGHEDSPVVVRVRVADLMGRAGRSQRELEMLRDLAGLPSASPSVLLALARREVAAKHSSHARIALRRLRSVGSASHLRESLRLEALLEEQAGHIDRALDRARQASELSEPNLQVLVLRARLADKKGYRSEALASARRAADIDPTDASVLRLLHRLNDRGTR